MSLAQQMRASAKAKSPVGDSQKAKVLSRHSSKVQAVEAGAKNFYVWTLAFPGIDGDQSRFFWKCLVMPGSTETQLRVKVVDPPTHGDEQFEISHLEAFNANLPTIDSCKLPDAGLLPHQNAAAVLDYFRQRYINGEIYTFVDPLLVAMNPFKDLGNATQEDINRYRDAPDPYRLSPHLFTVARISLETMHALNKSQTIIVTGESGAGKTEATKQIMRFFASAKGSVRDSSIQDAVMAGNPVLEAFGNAKTLRNNNSSRFGRFMQLQIEPSGGIQGGNILCFLLEKVRITFQEANERSYHIFYQMLKATTPEEKEKFLLLPMNKYTYLTASAGGCFDAEGISDEREFEDVRRAFLSMNINHEEQDAIFMMCSGILMLGNVTFIAKTIAGQDRAADLTSEGRKLLFTACGLMGLDGERIVQGLTTTIKKIGGETVTQRVVVDEAKLYRDSLAKALYEKLFQYVILRLNTRISPPGGIPHFIGMLDIFGFEFFERNSLEQLLINITNEFLQKNFVDVSFERETKLYKDEGISSAELIWTDNKAVIECLIAKQNSIFAVLEDACMAPGGSDESFVNNLKESLRSNPAFKEDRRGGSLLFVVEHTIAGIAYDATNFIVKNKDLLKSELVETAQASIMPLTNKLFDGVVVEKGKLAKGQLIASQFLRQLTELMDLILTTEPHFIRCVKPNETKVALEWNGSKVLNQMFSLSILEALQLKQLGYSYRRPFAEFCQQFRMLDVALVDSDMDRKECAKKLIERVGLGPKEWAIGKTMIFMKPESLKFMTRRTRDVMSAWEPTVLAIEASWLRHRRRVILKQLLPSNVRVQAHGRWYCYVGQHRKRM